MMWGDGGALLAAIGTIYTSGRIMAILKPDADVVDGGWTNELGNNTNMFSSLNESAPSDDLNYIVSSVAPVADVVRVGLSNPSVTATQPFKVRYHYEGTGAVNLTVRLCQGASTIATWTDAGLSGDWVTATQTLTAPQFAAITDFTDLFIEFQADAA